MAPFFRLDLLPIGFVTAVFSLLPIDQRLLCELVCSTWLAAVRDWGCWVRVDLSADTGSLRRPANDALLTAVAARANGRLQWLDVSACNHISMDVLCTVLSTSPMLRDLFAFKGTGGITILRRPTEYRDDHFVKSVLAAAPQLEAFHTDVYWVYENKYDTEMIELGVNKMLLREGEFAALCIRHLHVEAPVAVERLLHCVGEHDTLRGLGVAFVPLHDPGLMRGIVDVTIKLRLDFLRFTHCKVSPEHVGMLGEVLGSGSLTELTVQNMNGGVLFDKASAGAFADVLRSNDSLLCIKLADVELWNCPETAAIVLDALVGHASIKRVCFAGNVIDLPTRPDVGILLGNLVAANSPVLKHVDVGRCEFDDVTMGPIVDALQMNEHLQSLTGFNIRNAHSIRHGCRMYTDHFMTQQFEEARLLPAVLANQSLRLLRFHRCPIQAEQVVAARARLDSA